MKRLIPVKYLALLSVNLTFCTLIWAQEIARPQLLAHFMPWHQTPEISGYWGYHWTMRHFNPENRDDNGRREIASHYYPLTGPYDSQDGTILEYQTLLMKISGIDGVIVDWYGMEDFWDYGVLNAATHATFAAIERAKLSFSICYEDQTVMHMINNGRIPVSEALTHGKKVMQYLQDHWFIADAYVKIDGRPLLLVFGPQYFKNSSDWNALFADLPTPPMFFTEDNRVPPAVGAYPWPPMWKSVNGVLTQAALNEYLTQFYQKAKSWPKLTASAFPGFNDIYKEAGVGDGYGFLDARDGETFRFTLQFAYDRHADVIQLVTWNDYGEGTVIEPTEEFGYRYLETVQEFRRASDASFPFGFEELRLPLRIRQMRREYVNDAQVNADLDRVFDFLIAGDVARAETLLNKLPSKVGERNEAPSSFLTIRNYPNPFNAATTIAYQLPQQSFVELAIYAPNGRLVQRLLSETQAAGAHSINWRGDVPSGVYVYRLTAGQKTVSGKFLTIK